MARIVAIDQGTTNTKAVLYDGGRVVRSASEPVIVTFPQPGWVESDALAVWQTVLDVVERVTGDERPGSVDAIGISNQRESAALWERATGEPLGPLVSWQCGRGAAICNRPAVRAAAGVVEARTGLTLGPMFSAPKIAWLLEHTGGGAAVQRGALAAGTVDTWLLARLTGTTATDLTNASRTLLVDLDRCAWDDELLACFGIPRACLADIVASSGVVARGGAHLPPALRGVPVAAIAGDSHAALVGHHATRPGTMKATLGTGSSVMAVTDGRQARPGLSTTIGWSAGGPHQRPWAAYALEGNIYAAGATLDWAAALLGLPDPAALELLARECDTADGAVLVPAFSGLGAPHWDPDASGTLTGLTRGTSRANVARAAFDAVAHQVADVVDAMHQGPPPVGTALVVDGGASRSTLLLERIADLAGVRVQRPDVDEVACRGIALLAAHALGDHIDLGGLPPLPADATYDPSAATDRRRADRARWHRAIARARHREDD